MSSQCTAAREVWRAIPFAEGYEVSDAGRFRSRWEQGGADPAPRLGSRWRVLKGSRAKAGYVQHYIRTGDGLERWWLHRVVAWVFHGPAPFEGAEVRHLDGNPRNNVAGNLAWGTHAENMTDVRRHGTARTGETVPNASLSDDQAREIVRLHATGISQATLVKQFKVSPMTVSRIVRGLKWSNVTGVQPAIRSTLDGGDSPPVAAN